LRGLRAQKTVMNAACMEPEHFLSVWVYTFRTQKKASLKTRLFFEFK